MSHRRAESARASGRTRVDASERASFRLTRALCETAKQKKQRRAPPLLDDAERLNACANFVAALLIAFE